ncbi:hypothetical protein RVR_2499 [Actinacidiphila reveromycinica]|uniref:HTH tetR-type domain-containing protein n=1 Tax=Actinacidiphila reveromycinica TaxID=659352 RepID=A0A7U3VMU1_9ACTN|nr:TetR/AcrR family transcriptional regulator [Streptomyces sp. SN-593]BBA96965.1 hypothetical protein RVR_2499 [Streptomyces sp. SN-593]
MRPEPLRGPAQRADARANREAILAAAARLYADRDPAIPSIDIAKAAGVGRATLARHFPTPQSLRLAVFEQLIEQIERIASSLPDGPGVLPLFIGRVIDLFDDNAPLVDLIRSARDPRAGTDDLVERLRAAVTPVLWRAREAGVIDTEVDAEDFRLLIFMASSATRTHPGPDARARIARLVWNALRRSFEQPPPAPPAEAPPAEAASTEQGSG